MEVDHLLTTALIHSNDFSQSHTSFERLLHSYPLNRTDLVETASPALRDVLRRGLSYLREDLSEGGLLDERALPPGDPLLLRAFLNGSPIFVRYLVRQDPSLLRDLLQREALLQGNQDTVLLGNFLHGSPLFLRDLLQQDPMLLRDLLHREALLRGDPFAIVVSEAQSSFAASASASSGSWGSSPYHQLPRDQRYIRLFRLKSAGAMGFRCILKTVPLKDVVGQYDALSYVWGSEEPTYPLHVNGAVIHVRRNLFGFLENLFTDLLASEKLFWADAICINQSDIDEKGHQVNLMRDVYKSSKTTRVWLGQSSERTIQAAFDGFVQSTNFSDRKIWLDELDLVLTNEYWTRLWIVQEIIVSPEVEVRTSAGSISWTALVELLQGVEDVLREAIEDIEKTDKSGLRRLSASTKHLSKYRDKLNRSMVFALDRQKEDQTKRTLSELITAYCHCDCANILDKVYGLLGLTSDFDFDADYSLSRDQLFHRLMQYYPAQPVENLAIPLARALEFGDDFGLEQLAYARLTVPVSVQYCGRVTRCGHVLKWDRDPDGTFIPAWNYDDPIRPGDLLYSLDSHFPIPRLPNPRCLVVIRHSKILAPNEVPSIYCDVATSHIIGLAIVFAQRVEPQIPFFVLPGKPFIAVPAAQTTESQIYGQLTIEVTVGDLPVLTSSPTFGLSVDDRRYKMHRLVTVRSWTASQDSEQSNMRAQDGAFARNHCDTDRPVNKKRDRQIVSDWTKDQYQLFEVIDLLSQARSDVAAVFRRPVQYYRLAKPREITRPH